MQLQTITNKTFQIFFCLFIAVFISCNITAKENSAENKDTVYVKDTTVAKPDIASTPVLDNASLISCSNVGIIAIGDSYTEVERKAGKENITLDSNYNEGEFAGTYNTLWKNSPMELKVYWDDTTKNKKVGSIEIENEKSIYQFANGVKIGSTLDELVKMNENKPLRFYGFDWDYGGMIINEGKGIGSYKCFSGTLNYTGNSIDKKFLGDKEMNSSMQGVPLKKIYLSSISISKPDK